VLACPCHQQQPDTSSCEHQEQQGEAGDGADGGGRRGGSSAWGCQQQLATSATLGSSCCCRCCGSWCGTAAATASRGLCCCVWRLELAWAGGAGRWAFEGHSASNRTVGGAAEQRDWLTCWLCPPPPSPITRSNTRRRRLAAKVFHGPGGRQGPGAACGQGGGAGAARLRCAECYNTDAHTFQPPPALVGACCSYSCQQRCVHWMAVPHTCHTQVCWWTTSCDEQTVTLFTVSVRGLMRAQPKLSSHSM
jgi:hypothetical protein